MKAIRLSIALTILLASSSCAIYHHYGPYYGKLVDAETKQPLEGAVILADYYTWLYASPGGPAVYFLDAQEAVSDKNGGFRIPSLNAFAFRPLSTFNSEPGITIFKPRYKCYDGQLIEDQYQTIELRELKSTKERIRNTDCYPTIVPEKKMRKYIQIVNSERVELGLEAEYGEENKK